VSIGTLNPAFSSGVYAYSVSVPYNSTSITLTATATNAHATISGDTGEQPLTANTTTLTITVTAENGISHNDYIVTVNRSAANNDATLSSLTLSTGDLTPAFSSTVYVYESTVPYEVTELTVNATTNNSNATINGIGLKQLAIGLNTIIVTVTAENGTTVQNYTLKITRDNPIGIDELGITNYELGVYPNPVNETLNFSSETAFEIFDVQGRILMKDTQAVKSVDVSSLQAGMYFVRINNTILKFVKD
jgi:hypothetical protein